jgi:hypothetical protein
MVPVVALAETVILVEQVLVVMHPAVAVEPAVAAMECQVELESTQTSLGQHLCMEAVVQVLTEILELLLQVAVATVILRQQTGAAVVHNHQDRVDREVLAQLVL